MLRRRPLRKPRGRREKREGNKYSLSSGSLLEARNRLRLIVINLEDGEELGDLQQVVHLLGQAQQLQLPPLVRSSCKAAHQFANARAIDVGHIRQIQQNMLLILRQKVADELA